MTESPLAEEAALDAISAGQADIALVSNNLPFRNDIATAMPLYPTVLHIARRADDPRPSDPDLFRDATIYAGPEGSASRLVFERIAARIGLADGDYRYTTDPVNDPPVVVIVFAPISPERVEEFPDLVLTSIGTPTDIDTGGHSVFDNVMASAVSLLRLRTCSSNWPSISNRWSIFSDT